MKRPVLIELYGGAGGAAVGYHRAGFQVIGVDIEYQPAYPYTQITADVTTLDLPKLIESTGAVAVHAGPPCQRYSRLRYYQPDTIEARYADLIGKTREMLEPLGLPFVIENVEQARPELRDPIMLCGTQFENVEVIRHRLFEGHGFELVAPEHDYAAHPPCVRNGYLPGPGEYMTISGGKHSAAWQRRACQAMGTEWMRTVREVCEAIPPVYTEYVGRQLMAQVRGRVAA